MQRLKCAKPATANGAPASSLELLAGPLDALHTPSAIVAQLIGSDRVVVGDISARTALDLCRALLAAGAAPNATLICYRGDLIALRIRSIGDGAKLTIREDGLRVVLWKAFCRRAVAAPMRQIEKAV